MKNKTVFIVLFFCFLLLTGCGGSPSSEKSAELSEKYDYYTKSVNQLRTIKDSTPDQLDNIFLVLVDCGLNSEITMVSAKIGSDDPAYNVWSGSTEYTVTLDSSNVIQTVTIPDWLSTKQLYPAIPEETEDTAEVDKVEELTSSIDIPARENAIGQSRTDISALGKNIVVMDVRNDITGNWRYITLSESTDFLEYALSYYNTYFENDNEIHAVVNFTNKTTTKISVYGDELNITVYEYVDGEEHDAKLMYSGTVYSEYRVYMDNGDIEQIK